MAHDYHEGLPGFDPAQILHDGCAECEARSNAPDHGIANLDVGNFKLAWRRAADWNQAVSGPIRVSSAERPLLEALWSVQLQLEKRGLRIGYLPDELREALSSRS